MANANGDPVYTGFGTWRSSGTGRESRTVAGMKKDGARRVRAEIEEDLAHHAHQAVLVFLPLGVFLFLVFAGVFFNQTGKSPYPKQPFYVLHFKPTLDSGIYFTNYRFYS